MDNHGLTEQHLEIIAEILRPYMDKITQIGLFGSRAKGNYNDYSDVDMVLYGTISESDTDRIYTLFQESYLPFKVDVIAYQYITYPPLKEHIKLVMKPLTLI
jgi:uncharacterized protein